MRRKQNIEELGPIRDDETYPAAVFAKKTGTGKHLFAQMRRQGLQICRVGGRVFVRGRDFSEFLGNLASDGQEGGEQ